MMLRVFRFRRNAVIHLLLIAGLMVVIGAPPAAAASPGLKWTWVGDYEAFTETSDNSGEFAKKNNYLRVELEDGGDIEFGLSDNKEMDEGDEYKLTGTLPDDLELHVLQVDNNTVEIYMDGEADAHDYEDNVDGLYITFLDDAFDGGDAEDVDDIKSSELEIHFINSIMTFDPNPMTFHEDNDNNGSIKSGDVLKVTLKGSDEFVDEDFDEGEHFKVKYLPDGLEMKVERVDDDELEISLDGEAEDHDSSDNTEIKITFLDDAFDGGEADAIRYKESPVVKVSFGSEYSINWSATDFMESAANDGSIDTVLIATLASASEDGDEDNAEAFTGPNNEVMASDLYELSNLPAGLTAQLFKSSNTRVEVRLLGNASSHTAADSISNLGIAFQDEAFTGEDASGIANSSKTGLNIKFSGESSSVPQTDDGLNPVVSTFKLNQANYVVNGTSYAMDASPYASSDRTFVPLRYLGYALGMKEDQVVWDGNSQRAFLTQGNKTVYVQIGSQWLTQNDQSQLMDVEPQIVNQRVFLPARFIAEAFGAKVEWVQATQTVIISRE